MKKTNAELAKLNLESALKALEKGNLRAAYNIASAARDDLKKALLAKEGK